MAIEYEGLNIIDGFVGTGSVRASYVRVNMLSARVSTCMMLVYAGLKMPRQAANKMCIAHAMAADSEQPGEKVQMLR